MTVKSTAEGDGLGTETMADRLKIVQGEQWRKMRYTDENEEAAWDVYSESMFLRRPEEPNSAAGKEEAAAPEKPLEETVPRFESRWEDKKLLETISGIIKDEGDEEDDVKAEEEAQMKAIAEAEERKKAATTATRTRGGGAAGAARRGGRPKPTAARSATVNID